MSGARVLVVGGGLTAAALASRLSGLAVGVTCWDKAYQSGGRMTTKRHNNSQVDLGPQFITKKYGGEESIFKDLVDSGTIKPVRMINNDSNNFNFIDNEHVTKASTKPTLKEHKLNAVGVDDTIRMIYDDLGDGSDIASSLTYLVKPDNYVAVNGSNQIVEHFWEKSGVKLHTEHFLDGLDSVDKHWVASSSAQGKKETFDAVVFTQPVPQYINLHSPEGRPIGNYLDIMKENKKMFEQLEKVRYYSSFSLGIMYNETQTLALDWTVKYFPTNKILRYVCVDSVRRGRPLEPTSILVQTQRTWSEENLHLDKHQACPIILAELQAQVGDLPEPDHVFPHRWRYSQTAAPFAGSPGAVVLNDAPLLIGAGDSFAVSNVEGCLYSAKVAAELIKRLLVAN